MYKLKFVIGGEGISGLVFVDNVKYCEYLFVIFYVSVFDMESVVVVYVVYVNSVLFIVFCSLLDLVGGDVGVN